MNKNTAPSPSGQPALEFKGSMLTTMVLYLYDVESTLLEQELEEKVRQAPGMFKNAPLVIDLQAVKDSRAPLDVPFLARQLKRHGLLPMAVRGGSAQQHTLAVNAGLGLLAEAKIERQARAKKSAAPALPPGSKVIAQPVRSGQQVVANQGDLVILSMVSAGAEVLAAGDIHVYGALRGRALAGVTGNSQARIFCQQFDAELVAVAGNYQVNEDFRSDVRNKPVQVYLEEEKLHIQVFA